jgi:hypothetical protein
MRPRIRRPGPRRRQCLPGVEGLESRDLPSGMAAGTVKVDIPPTASPSFEPPNSPVSSLYHQPLVPNLGLITQFVAMAYPAPALQPTQAEINREYFLGKFEGSYTVTPGRFGYQAVTIHGVSVDGGTNQFLHGRMQFTIYPTAAGNPEPLTGEVGFIPQNYLQASDLLIFDLSAAPAGEPTGQTTESGAPQDVGNGLSLPTHLHWSADSLGAGGYTAPLGFNQSGGYMDIDYIPDKHAKPGTLASGKMIVLYQGLINTSSVLNPLDPGIV